MGLEHQRKLARLREFAAAGGTTCGQLTFAWRFTVIPPGEDLVQGAIIDRSLDEMVQAKATIAFAAVDHHVVERLDVAGGFPDARVHDDGRVHADHVLALRHHRRPPGVENSSPQFNAEGTIVPESVQPSVYFAALEDVAPSLTQRNEGFEIFESAFVGHR